MPSASKFLFLIVAVGCVGQQPGSKPVVPQTAEELFQVGQAHAARGNFLRAEQYMASGLRAGYEEATAIHQLLEVCFEGSFLRAGIEHAKWYLNRRPADMSVRLSLAALYFGVGELERAKRQLRVLHHQDSNTANAHYLSGAVAWTEGPQSWQSAEKHWQKYLELAPQGPRAIEVELKLREIRRIPKRSDPSSVQALDKNSKTDAGVSDSSAPRSRPMKLQPNEHTP